MRCTLCNNPLKSSEIIWYPEEKRHEDKCGRCRATIARDMLSAGWNPEHTLWEPVEVGDGENGG